MEIYHGDPLKQVAPGPPAAKLVVERPQTRVSLSSAVFSPSSPLLFSPLSIHFCCGAVLLAADCPSAPLLCFLFHECGVTLFYLYFKHISYCKNLTWTASFGSHSSISETQRSRQVFFFPSIMFPQMISRACSR